MNVAQAQVAQAQSQVNLTQKQYVRAQALYAHELIARQDLEQAQANAQQAQAALAAGPVRSAPGRGPAGERAEARPGRPPRAGPRDGGLPERPARAPSRSARPTRPTCRPRTRWRRPPPRCGCWGAGPWTRPTRAAGMLDVTAPIAGTVSGRSVTLGQSVTPDMPLLTVLDLRTVVVQLTVYQEDLAHLRVGQPVAVTSNTAPGRDVLRPHHRDRRGAGPGHAHGAGLLPDPEPARRCCAPASTSPARSTGRPGRTPSPCRQTPCRR